MVSKKYVLMLVYVDSDLIDIGDHQYPEKGYVEAENFFYNEDIQTGLLGIPWGRADKVFYEDLESNNWLVVKIENNPDLFCVNNFYNQYKFRNGLVLHKGDICSCSQYILNIIHDAEQSFDEEIFSIPEEEIIGTEKWKNKNIS